MTRAVGTGTADATVGRSQRIEGMVQVVIMLAIGTAAGAASFTHVHDVAAGHGQPGWLAWADAITLELMSIASGLELRRRRRTRQNAALPESILAVAVLLSLSAQVVEAEPSAIGWLAAALPALGFLAMAKIALGRAGPGRPDRAQTSAKPAGTASDIMSRPAAPGPIDDAIARLAKPAGMDGRSEGSADPPPQHAVRPRTGTRSRRTGPSASRRTAAQTRRLAIELLAAEPMLTRTQIADRLGVSTRWLRQLIASHPDDTSTL